jgi:sigma-B regulation protein RsbU (phosphoserine phosphatase)
MASAQRAILPQRAPASDDYRLALAYKPACFVTGDYHDFFPRAQGQMAAFVGDGSGHGPTASILVASMRAILRTHPERHTTPGQTLTFAGRMFHDLVSPGQFMTGLYLVLGAQGLVSWAAAGQDPPLRINRRGDIAPVDVEPVGLPLGIEPEVIYPTVQWQLEPGERLVLFTDGLVEAAGAAGDLFGRARLRAAVSALSHLSLQEMILELVVHAAAHCGAQFEDDFTILGIERPVDARLN